MKNRIKTFPLFLQSSRNSESGMFKETQFVHVCTCSCVTTAVFSVNKILPVISISRKEKKKEYGVIKDYNYTELKKLNSSLLFRQEALRYCLRFNWQMTCLGSCLLGK